MALRTLARNLAPMPSRIDNQTTRDKRMTGRRLQQVRLDMWSKNPYCARCGRITAHPYGYEIDHIVSLEHGGSDSDSNRQLLCATIGDEEGCHAVKTREDG